MLLLVEYSFSNVKAVIYIMFTSPRLVRPLPYSWRRWECGSVEITTVSRWRQHLQSGHSCARSRIYGSTAARRPPYRCTWDCPAGLFLCQAQSKLVPEPPWPPRSRADGIQPVHQGGPKHRHTLCPIQNLSTSPPDPHSCAGHPPASPFLQKQRGMLDTQVHTHTHKEENMSWCCANWKFIWPTFSGCWGGGGHPFCYSKVTRKSHVEHKS